MEENKPTVVNQVLQTEPVANQAAKTPSLGLLRAKLLKVGALPEDWKEPCTDLRTVLDSARTALQIDASKVPEEVLKLYAADTDCPLITSLEEDFTPLFSYGRNAWVPQKAGEAACLPKKQNKTQ